MAILTDGIKTAEITMQEWTPNGYKPDFSNDFFSTSSLTYLEKYNAYVVQDVDYCVDYARDWLYCEGDFADFYFNPNNDVNVCWVNTVPIEVTV